MRFMVQTYQTFKHLYRKYLHVCERLESNQIYRLIIVNVKPELPASCPAIVIRF